MKVTLADEAPLACNMSMEPNPVTVHEGQTANFTIVIDPPLPRDDTLLWWVHPHGEASTPEDIPSTSGRADLKAGATSVVGAVTPNIDDETEPTEGFQIVMDWASWRALPDWRSTPSCAGTIYIRDGESNAPPVFADDAPPTRKVAENTASGRPVGKPVTAEDPNDDPVTYALEGPDAASFRIDTGDRPVAHQGRARPRDEGGLCGDGEADDDWGGTATIAVTVNVDDEREPPGTPDAPSVSASGRSLSVSWSAPENTGPPMTYDLRHREPGRGWRTDGPRDVDGGRRRSTDWRRTRSTRCRCWRATTRARAAGRRRVAGAPATTPRRSSPTARTRRGALRRTRRRAGPWGGRCRRTTRRATS